MKVVIDNMSEQAERVSATFDTDPQTGDLVALDVVRPNDVTNKVGFAPRPPTVSTASMTSKKGVRSAVVTVRWPLYRGTDVAADTDAATDPGFAQVQLKYSLPNTKGCRPTETTEDTQAAKNAKALCAALNTLLALTCHQGVTGLALGMNPFKYGRDSGGLNVFQDPDSVILRGMAGITPLNAQTAIKKLSGGVDE